MKRGIVSMSKDSAMVELLSVALNASNPARQIAASLLLDVIRNDTARKPKLPAETIEANATPEVVTELHKLIDEYGLRDRMS